MLEIWIHPTYRNASCYSNLLMLQAASFLLRCYPAETMRLRRSHPAVGPNSQHLVANQPRTQLAHDAAGGKPQVARHVRGPQESRPRQGPRGPPGAQQLSGTKSYSILLLGCGSGRDVTGRRTLMAQRPCLLTLDDALLIPNPSYLAPTALTRPNQPLISTQTQREKEAILAEQISHASLRAWLIVDCAISRNEQETMPKEAGDNNVQLYSKDYWYQFIAGPREPRLSQVRVAALVMWSDVDQLISVF